MAKMTKADDDYRLAAETVGRGAIGDLQQRLRQPVGPRRDARPDSGFAAGMSRACTGTGRIRNKPSMRSRKNRCEAGAGALFVARHRVGRGKHGE